MKNAKYICPKCGVAEGVSLDKSIYEGLTAKGETKDLLVIMMECPTCKAVWHEAYVLDYDGYTYHHREYDREGDLLVDWQNEILTAKGARK